MDLVFSSILDIPCVSLIERFNLKAKKSARSSVISVNTLQHLYIIQIAAKGSGTAIQQKERWNNDRL